MRLLEALALNKVSEGDDDGARRVLQVGRDGGTSCWAVYSLAGLSVVLKCSASGLYNLLEHSRPERV